MSDTYLSAQQAHCWTLASNVYSHLRVWFARPRVYCPSRCASVAELAMLRIQSEWDKTN